MGVTQHAIKGKHFALDARYQIKKQKRQGAFGVSYVAQDTAANGGAVELVYSKSALEYAVDAQKLLLELKLLQHMEGHENILALTDVLPPNAEDGVWRHVFYAVEATDTDA